MNNYATVTIDSCSGGCTPAHPCKSHRCASNCRWVSLTAFQHYCIQPKPYMRFSVMFCAGAELVLSQHCICQSTKDLCCLIPFCKQELPEVAGSKQGSCLQSITAYEAFAFDAREHARRAHWTIFEWFELTEVHAPQHSAIRQKVPVDIFLGNRRASAAADARSEDTGDFAF
eukprot:3290385-Pleurochrysis_carterae.AAC.2